MAALAVTCAHIDTTHTLKQNKPLKIKSRFIAMIGRGKEIPPPTEAHRSVIQMYTQKETLSQIRRSDKFVSFLVSLT